MEVDLDKLTVEFLLNIWIYSENYWRTQRVPLGPDPLEFFLKIKYLPSNLNMDPPKNYVSLPEILKGMAGQTKHWTNMNWTYIFVKVWIKIYELGHKNIYLALTKFAYTKFIVLDFRCLFLIFGEIQDISWLSLIYIVIWNMYENTQAIDTRNSEFSVNWLTLFCLKHSQIFV